MEQTASVEVAERDGVEIVTLRSEADVFAEVAPSLGNNCFAFVAGRPVLEPVAWDAFLKKPTSYGIPVLFPYPNRVRDMRFTFRGETFTLDTPQHGFVRGRPWRVAATGTDDGAAWLRSTFDAAEFGDEILGQFPFPFRLDVVYTLRGRTLEMRTRVENAGERDMPYGFGIHPYFRKPARGAIRVPASGRWELEDHLPTGEVADVAGAYDLREGADVATAALDDIFTRLTADADGLVRCTLDDAEAGTRTTVEFSRTEFPHVVVFTPPREAICIEPNTFPTDAFNLAARGIAADVRVLAPGAVDEFTIRISA